MSDPPAFPVRRLLFNSAVAGLVAGSTAATVIAFEVLVGILDADWTRLVDSGGPVLAVAGPAGIVGGILYGLLIGLLARPLARIPSPATRRVAYVVLFSLGFVALAAVGLASGVPPLRPLAALVVVAVAAGCAWISVPGFDRPPRA